MLSSRLSHVSLTQSASFDSDSESLHGSPRYKMVSTCLNCSYTFRTGSSTCPDFCSKDCQTCYLIYISNPSHTPKAVKNKNDLKTNKQLVYEFQREIDRKEDARSEESEKMVDIDQLPSSCKIPSKLMKIEIPSTPGSKKHKQYVTPNRPIMC